VTLRTRVRGLANPACDCYLDVVGGLMCLFSLKRDEGGQTKSSQMEEEGEGNTK
jgi:hypothetical protein